jgi:hypothetical protein
MRDERVTRRTVNGGESSSRVCSLISRCNEVMWEREESVLLDGNWEIQDEIED